MTKVQDRDLDHERRDALAHAANVTSMWSDALTLRHPSEDCERMRQRCIPILFASSFSTHSSSSDLLRGSSRFQG